MEHLPDIVHSAAMSTRWSAEVDRDDSIDDESYQMREVYAHFGVAVYMAQVLEHGVINLLAVTRVMSLASSQEEYDKLVGKKFKDTLGNLAKELKSVALNDEKFIDDLARLVQVRNHLVHNYWREKIQLTMTPQGRNRLIEELSEIHASFSAFDKRLDDLTFRYSEARGSTSREQVEQLIRDQRQEVTALSGYLPHELPDLTRAPDGGAKR